MTTTLRKPTTTVRVGAASRTATTLTFVAIIAATIASIGGLAVHGLYTDDTAWATAALRGGDLVTLVLVVPGLISATLLARRGSVRARLIWGGLLGYGVYNFAFYVFGAAFNDLFLAHVVGFSASIFALIAWATELDAPAIAARFDVRTPARAVAVLLLAVAGVFATLWTTFSLAYAVTAASPSARRRSPACTSCSPSTCRSWPRVWRSAESGSGAGSPGDTCSRRRSASSARRTRRIWPPRAPSRRTPGSTAPNSSTPWAPPSCSPSWWPRWRCFGGFGDLRRRGIAYGAWRSQRRTPRSPRSVVPWGERDRRVTLEAPEVMSPATRRPGPRSPSRQGHDHVGRSGDPRCVSSTCRASCSSSKASTALARARSWTSSTSGS